MVGNIFLDVDDGFAEGDEEFFHEGWGDNVFQDVFQGSEEGAVDGVGSQMREFEAREVAEVADGYLDEARILEAGFLRYLLRIRRRIKALETSS